MGTQPVEPAQSGPPGVVTDEHEDTRHVVVFRVGTEEFAIDILRVHEIIRPPQLTQVPNSPEFVEGVMNLRGKVIPAISLRRRFGWDAVAHDRRTRVVVVNVGGTLLGCTVDSVAEVIRIPKERIESTPRLHGTDRECVSGVARLGNRLLALLEVDRLLQDAAWVCGSGLEAGAL